MKYTPNEYNGNFYTEIFSEILESTDLFEKGLVRVLDNIKYQQAVTSMSGDVVGRPYEENPDISKVTSLDIDFADKIVQPVKMMVLHTISREALRTTRFSELMKAGADNMDMTEWDTLVINYLSSKLKTSIVKDFLTSVITKAKTDVPVANQVKVNVTSENVYEVLDDLTAHDAVQDVIASGDVHLLADNSFKHLIQTYNKAQDFRDGFEKQGEDYYINEVKIVFQKLGKGVALLTRPSDIVLATDLTSDFGKIETGMVNNYGDLMFIKAVYTLDSAIVIPSQKLLLLPATV